MNTKLIRAALLILLLSGCSAPKYLPSPDTIDVNAYGSYIKLKQMSGSKLYGELIAIDSIRLVVLTNEEKNLVAIPVRTVEKFNLSYAKSKHYGWTIPLGILTPFINGFYSIFTLPLHLIVSITTTVSGEKAFTYSDKNMTYDQLKMFARFPQGLPQGFNMAEVK
ncbi:MAG: hypothetical protein ACKO3B_01705 [Bacteroidota bacterium]